MRVLVITGNRIGAKMAGPSIRAWNIALALSTDNDLTLVTTSELESIAAPFAVARLTPGDERSYVALESGVDVVVFQGLAMSQFASLRRSSKIVVVDVYDPMHLEQLEQARGLSPEDWARRVRDATWMLNDQLASGDFFLCASERQRQLYIGQLGALGRVNPQTYSQDPTLSRLIAVAPFGLDRAAPVHSMDVLKGVIPGISRDDKVLLWSGGLYNWFDPETLIKAVHALSRRRDNVRLFFQGTKLPGVPEMEIVQDSRDLATSLGALGTSVFFNDSWVDFDQRQNYLLEADVGVSTHEVHVETTFSFRTRILDYLWAGLPMVVTEGDSFAELVRERELGIVVPARDADALGDALERVLFDSEFRERAIANVAVTREEFFWDITLHPLVEFVRTATPAADRTGGARPRGAAAVRAVRRMKPLPRNRIARAARLVTLTLRDGGFGLVANKVARRLRRRG